MESEAKEQDDTQAAIMAIIRRGGTAGLTPEEKARYLQALCKSLGINELTMPIQFITFQGKEIAYVTRGATDQLAAKHNVSRFVVEGPCLKDFSGTKLLYCRVEAKMPNGRCDTSIATSSARIDENSLMKVESKAKRRATLSILGLGMLAEEEADDLSASQSGPATNQPRAQAEKASPSKALSSESYGIDEASSEALNAGCMDALGLSDPDEIAVSLVRLYNKYLALAVDREAFFDGMKRIAKRARCATRFQQIVAREVAARASAISRPPPDHSEEIETTGLDDVLELINAAETATVIATIISEHADVPVEDKKLIWASGWKNVQKLHVGSGFSLDAEEAKNILRLRLDVVRAEADAARAKAAAPKIEPWPQETAKPAATILDDTPEGERLWIDHLRAKMLEANAKDAGNDGGSLAGSFAKREKEFRDAGVRDARLRTVVNTVDGIRGRGPIEALTFVNDVIKSAENKRSKALRDG